jgi:hypothetical protein
MWLLCAAIMTAVVLLAVGPTTRIAEWFCCSTCADTIRKTSYWHPQWLENLLRRALRFFSNLQNSGLMNPQLARRLVMYSVARFAVVVLMAGETAKAIGAFIPLWHMTAAIPFSCIANVIGLTPGGIGVNELTTSTALHFFGTSMTVATHWALANRLLGMGSCFTVAGCALTVFGGSKIVFLRLPVSMQDH